MNSNKLWIFLLGAVLYLVIAINSASARTLVNFPRPVPPKPPKPTTKFLGNLTTVGTFPTPLCTTIDNINGPSQNNVTTRNGVTNTNLRWKQFNVLPDSNFEQWEMDVINLAMWKLWQVLPCISFGIYPKGSNPTGDYMRLVKGINNGCNSYVGRMGWGRQDINLQSPGCINVQTVMHEMMHALGFYHEHCRHDRDDYLNLYWDNMVPEYKFAFDKLNNRDTTTYGVPYNYNSIMHYENWAFSKNGMSTMTSKNGQHIGGAKDLQQTDIQKLKAMYNCQ